MMENLAAGDTFFARVPQAWGVAGYVRVSASGDSRAARRALLDSLAAQPEPNWLECAQALVLHGDLAAATSVLAGAGQENPDSVEACCAYASSLWQAGNPLQRNRCCAPCLRAIRNMRPRHSSW